LRERDRPRVAVVHGSNGVGGGGDGGRFRWYNAETSVLSFPPLLQWRGGGALLPQLRQFFPSLLLRSDSKDIRILSKIQPCAFGVGNSTVPTGDPKLALPLVLTYVLCYRTRGRKY
jgi:hypothetical protein